MMSAGRYDLVIERGATFRRVIEWKDEDGVLINLTGYTARLQVRQTPSAEAALLSLTGAPELVLGGVAGTITILLGAVVTKAIDWPSTVNGPVYDLELESSGGEVTRLLEGHVTVDLEVTR